MPMLIKDYVQNALASLTPDTPEVIDKKLDRLTAMLTKLTTFAPTELATRSSPHYSKIYEERLVENQDINHIMSWLVEKIFHPTLPAADTIASCLSFWQTLPCTQDEAQRLYAAHCALVFSFTGLGNCAKRAAYAAIELYDLLKNSTLTVQLKSYPEPQFGFS